MKTLELKLKKKVLIVDENDFEYYELSKNGIYFKIEKGDRYYLGWKFEFLCKGSELAEEIASELFEYDDFLNCFEAYIDTVPSINKSAFKLFIKIFESKEKFWLENPMKHPKDYEVFPDSLSLYAEQERLHFETEEKTFKNPLIFVKNS